MSYIFMGFPLLQSGAISTVDMMDLWAKISFNLNFELQALMNELSEVQQLLAATHADPDGVAGLMNSYSGSNAAAISDMAHDPEAMAAVGHRYERLDQIAMEHLLGVR